MVRVEPIEIDGVPLARILVPKAHSEVATSSGVYLRRRLKYDGTPECAPMLPHERISRAASFGLTDVSAQPVAGATLADLDPLERERLRQAVQQYGGDRVLLGSDFPTIPYPYLEQLEGLTRLVERHPALDDDWLRRVAWHNGVALFGEPPANRL